jgi:hypothetical protein
LISALAIIKEAADRLAAHYVNKQRNLETIQSVCQLLVVLERERKHVSAFIRSADATTFD